MASLFFTWKPCFLSKQSNTRNAIYITSRKTKFIQESDATTLRMGKSSFQGNKNYIQYTQCQEQLVPKVTIKRKESSSLLHKHPSACSFLRKNDVYFRGNLYVEMTS